MGLGLSIAAMDRSNCRKIYFDRKNFNKYKIKIIKSLK